MTTLRRSQNVGAGSRMFPGRLASDLESPVQLPPRRREGNNQANPMMSCELLNVTSVHDNNLGHRKLFALNLRGRGSAQSPSARLQFPRRHPPSRTLSAECLPWSVQRFDFDSAVLRDYSHTSKISSVRLVSTETSSAGLESCCGAMGPCGIPLGGLYPT